MKASPSPGGSVALGPGGQLLAGADTSICRVHSFAASLPLLPSQSCSGFRLLTAVSHLV